MESTRFVLSRGPPTHWYEPSDLALLKSWGSADVRFAEETAISPVILLALVETYEITLSNGTSLTVVDPPSFPDFWRQLAAGKWEPHTLKAIEVTVGSGMTFVDIGGWIGPTAMVAAAYGAEVYSFEPDPTALTAFRHHLGLNPHLAGRIHLDDRAVGAKSGVATIAAPSLGDSTSSLVKRQGEKKEIRVVSATEIVDQEWFRSAAMVKVDIEGGEFGLMRHLAPGLRPNRPPLLLSTHIDYLADKAPASPLWMRRAVKGIRLGGHERLLWDLRFYRDWRVAHANGWQPLVRHEAARRLLLYRNQEFLLCAEGLSFGLKDRS
jgi:FkbM family methyltransferase